MRLSRARGYFVLMSCAVLPAACSSAPSPRSGRVEVLAHTSAALSSADVSNVSVTVSGSNIAVPITTSLTDDDTGWHGTIGDIPPGTANFDGEAFDSAQNVLYAGSTPGVVISAGVTAVVGLLLQQTAAPPPFQDVAPVIQSFTASANVVAPGGSVTVSGTATGTGALTYAWTADGGSFASPAAAMTTWTAPETTGTSNLTFQATDPAGLTAGVTFTMNVQNDGAEVITTFNTWPTVGGMTATPTRIDAGDTTSLSISAADADGNALTYSWTSDCSGTFSAPSAASTSFTLSALPPGGRCTFVSTVADGRGGSNTGTVTLQAGAPPALVVCPAVGFGGSVDQSQYVADGDMGLMTNQEPGETFTVAQTGVLTGIETQLGPCNGTPADGAKVKMEIFDSNDHSLGSAVRLQSSFPAACGGQAMSTSATGAGLFDLTPLCIRVTAGEQLRFQLSLTDVVAGQCVSWRCSNGGDFCESDYDCSGPFFYVGVTNCGGIGCSGNPGDYTGGESTVIDQGGNYSVSGGFDLAFKTFVE